MNERWRIQLLGGLSAAQGDRSISRFRTQKTGALLAYLALFGDRAHSRDLLIDTLWPDSDVSSARNSLSVALNSLRRQLEPAVGTPGTSPIGSVLIADRSTVGLSLGAYTTDVATFEARLREAREATEDDGRIITLLLEATKAYAGQLLPAFFDDWVLRERERLADAYLQALRRLTSLFMEAREFDRALDCIHKAIQADPISEESRRLLIRLYAVVGRPEAGLKQLKELERLREAAGESPPSDDTRRLALRLAEGTDKDSGGTTHPRHSTRKERAVLPTDGRQAESTASLPEEASPKANIALPLAFTRFFGREREMQDIAVLLASESTRLLTLTGPGGVGKTRLAIEAAHRWSTIVPSNGVNARTLEVCFVPLVEVSEPARILETVRDTLRLPRLAQIDPSNQISDHLRGRASLLVLDNMEHLAVGGPLDKNGAAAVLASLLAQLPKLKIIATSRATLGIGAEQDFAVSPLPVPSEPPANAAALLEWPSVQLFVDRARSRRVDFQVTPRNADALGLLCARLEGLPLALELAAALTKLLSPAELLSRLDNRFDLLVSKRSNIPERQRTLYGTIDWGFNLLSPDVRRYFCRLSVFRGNWSIESAAAVCEGDAAGLANRTLECLTQLRDASFLTLDPSPNGTGVVDESRFRLLDTLREFAAEQLAADERNDVSARHTAYFLDLAESAAKHLRGPDQSAWFDRLETEHDNLRTVLERTISEEAGLRLVGAMAAFWKMRGYYREGLDWIDRALAASGSAQTAIRAKALSGAGALAYDQGQFEQSEAYFNECLAIWEALGDRDGTAIILNNLGNIAYRRGRLEAAQLLYTRSLEICRAADASWGIASALGNLANVAQAGLNYEAARQLHRESLALSRSLGDSRMTAYTLHNLANLAAELGEFAEARPLYEESLTGKRTLGDQRGVSSLLLSLGFLALEDGGAAAEAQKFLTEALTLAWKLGDRLTCVVACDGFAWQATIDGRHDRAACLWAAAASVHDLIQAPHNAGALERYTGLIDELQAAMPSIEAFNAASERGRAFTLEQVVVFALASDPDSPLTE